MTALGRPTGFVASSKRTARQIRKEQRDTLSKHSSPVKIPNTKDSLTQTPVAIAVQALVLHEEAFSRSTDTDELRAAVV
jgi:hypothetical protein